MLKAALELELSVFIRRSASFFPSANARGVGVSRVRFRIDASGGLGLRLAELGLELT
jgi:hypothetical protein